MATFEILPGVAPGGFVVSNFTATVVDAGQSPTNIIRATDQFAVEVKWTTSGPLSAHLPGNWHVFAFLESIGTGPDFDFNADVSPIPLTPGAGDINYTAKVTVPANTVKIPPGHPREAMPMKLVVTVTYDWGANNPGPMAGFIEMPVVLFFNP